MKKRITALLLSGFMLMTLFCPAAMAEETTIHIRTAQQLRALAENCIKESYSRELRVILDNDIDLEGKHFYPIPSFSGIFDGGGHTISNMILATDGSNQGMFRYLQDGAVIRNLNVEGTVEPDNSRCQVGGIVGTSYGTIEFCSFKGKVTGLNYVGGIVGENMGIISNCRSDGTISGKRFTGGIAGYSEGLVENCKNAAQVNTGINAGGIEFDSLTLNTLTGSSLTGAQDTDVVSDTGGIVGFSVGIIMDCENMGTIGYPHFGYNVGGIAGRHSGYISSCINSGSIFGRKDVAGIVGQMEPYLLLKDSRTLAQEVALLQSMIDATIADAKSQSANIEAALYGIREDAGSVIDEIYPQPTATPAPAAPPSTSSTTEGGGTATGTSYRRLGGSAISMGRIKHRTAARIEANYSSGGIVDGIQGAINNNKNNGSLREDLSNMGNDMEMLTSAMGETTGTLADNLSGVSAQFSKVMLMMINTLNGSANLDIYEDVSADEPEDSIQGKVSGCENRGYVEGDTNVGGIAGDMGIEYEFDLENQVMSFFKSSDIITSSYETKCISRANKNYGSINAKKEHVGGIAGQAQVGLVEYCEDYGSVESTEGGYVGGIVGNSMTSVLNCYSMCNLDGTEYVGGIAGYGTRIQNCAAIVGIGDATACSGAIAGWADLSDGESVSGNLYVGEGIGAVDGISYDEKADSVSYKQLLKTEGLPESFGELKLTFMADGVKVAEIPFKYGEGISMSELPTVPEKNGFNGHWEDYDYSSLYFCDDINAVYSSSQASLAVDKYREGSPQSIVLVEGEFTDKAKLYLNPFTGDDPNIELGQVLEKWSLTLEGVSGGERNYIVHYLEPEHTMRVSDIELYSYSDGKWSKIEATVNGSYLVFDWKDDSLVFCALESERAGLDAVIYIAAGLILLVLLILVIKNKKKKKSPAQDEPKNVTEEDRAVAQTGAKAPDESAAENNP